MSIECKIPCDICGTKPAYWFGQTSAAICTSPKCRAQNQQDWIRHCDKIAEETAFEQRMRDEWEQ